MTLQNLSYPTLIATLNKYTKRFIRFLLEDGKQEELENCRKKLDYLISEIRRRRRKEKKLQADEQLNSIFELISVEASQN